MKKRFKLIIISILLLIIATGCGKQVFNGNRTSNDVQFIMDFSVLNKTETHEMSLEEGTTVNVDIEKISGRIDILVEDIDGNKIYRGDNADSNQFSFDIPKSSTYIFSITGKKAKGSVSFKVSE